MEEEEEEVAEEGRGEDSGDDVGMERDVGKRFAGGTVGWTDLTWLFWEIKLGIGEWGTISCLATLV